MAYLHKILPKEAKDILDQCWTDGHATLQLFYLQFHPIDFLFQINECKVFPVQGNNFLLNTSTNIIGIPSTER